MPSSSSTRSAAIGGMVVGSLMTIVAMNVIFRRRRRTGADDNDNYNSMVSERRMAIREKTNKLQEGSGNNNANKQSFLSDLIQQMWSHLRVAGANKIRENLEPVFQDLPSPLNKLHFTKIDLGTVPIRMDDIVVHDINEIENHQIQMDMTVIWDGTCDIQLQIGGGINGGGVERGGGNGNSGNSLIKFGVEKIKLVGRMAMIFKPLTNELPIISGIQYSFINPPSIDLNFTGLANIADWNTPFGVDQIVRNSINESMLSMVLPNRSLYKMMSNNNYLHTYQRPLGVARITILSGRGFEIEKLFLGNEDIPDVYLNVSLGGTSDVWRTRTIQDDCNPTWGVEVDDDNTNGRGEVLLGDYGEFLVDDREQLITIHAWDEDRGMLDPDDDLGIAKVSVGELLLARGRSMELPLLFSDTTGKNKGKETGAFISIRLDLLEWTSTLGSLKRARSTRKLMQPLVEEEKKSNSNTTHNDDKVQQLDNTLDFRIGGLLVIIISRAMDIPVPREDAATYCKIKYGSNEFETSVITDSPGYNDGLNPIYDAAFRVALTPQRMQNTMGRGHLGPTASQVTIELFQSNEKSGTDSGNKTNGTTPTTILLGSTTVDFSVLSSAPENTITEHRRLGKDGTSGPTLEFRMSLSGVEPPPIPEEDLSLRPISVLSGTPTTPTSSAGQILRSKDGTTVGFAETIGTIRVTIVKARGLKIREELFMFDIPDVYCTVSLLGGEQPRSSSSKKRTSTTAPVWKTTTVHNTCLPTWDETKDFSIHDRAQVLHVEMWDRNEREYDPDVFVGSVSMTVGKLLLAGGNMDIPLKTDGGGRGTDVILTLKCEML